MKIMEDPFPSSPGQWEEARKTVLEHIEAIQDISPELKSEIAARAGDFLEPRHTKAGHHYGGQLGWTNWVIRNDDLDLVALLAPSAGGIATYATVPGASPYVLAATALFSVLGIARKLRGKSTSLDPDTYRLLMALKRFGPLNVTALMNILNRVNVVGAGPWNEERVLKTLHELQTVRVRDGSTEIYVTPGSDGQWSTNGI
jgi:hypothetical protein